MAELLDILQQQLDEDTIRELGERIGSAEAPTQRAVAMLVPALIAGLSRNAASASGRAELLGALQQDHDGSLLDQLGGVLRGEGSLGSVLGGYLGGIPARVTVSGTGVSINARQVDGPGILQHVLGSHQGPIAEAVARASGLEGDRVSQLMNLLAPVIMAALGKARQNGNLQADGTAGLLRNASRSLEQAVPLLRRQGGLANWLDSYSPGMQDSPDDIAKIGTAVASALLIGIGRRRGKNG